MKKYSNLKIPQYCQKDDKKVDIKVDKEAKLLTLETLPTSP
jgi:hypothetical protein